MCNHAHLSLYSLYLSKVITHAQPSGRIMYALCFDFVEMSRHQTVYEPVI